MANYLSLWMHQRPIKFIAFSIYIYKAILYYKKINIFITCLKFLFCSVLKMCTLNISDLISSYELKAACAQKKKKNYQMQMK